MNTNQNGVPKISENEATESINGDKIKKSGKLAEKTLQQKLEQLKTKREGEREKINAKLLRKLFVVNDTLYSFANAPAVAEEIEQFNDMLKLLTEANDEYQRMLKENKVFPDSQWFKEQDEIIFSFKHKIVKWFNEAELNREQVEYTKSVGSTRRKFKRSKSSRPSNASSRPSIKNKAIEEKIKVAQLIEESNFTEQKLKLECEAKRLEIEEKVPKLKHVT